MHTILIPDMKAANLVYMMVRRVFPRVVRVGWPEKVVPRILK